MPFILRGSNSRDQYNVDDLPSCTRSGHHVKVVARLGVRISGNSTHDILKDIKARNPSYAPSICTELTDECDWVEIYLPKDKSFRGLSPAPYSWSARSSLLKSSDSIETAVRSSPPAASRWASNFFCNSTLSRRIDFQSTVGFDDDPRGPGRMDHLEAIWNVRTSSHLCWRCERQADRCEHEFPSPRTVRIFVRR